MSTRLLTLICLTFLVALPATSCAEPGLPIKIGWVGPLSGNSAVLGIDGVVAVQMALDEVNASNDFKGRRLELVVEDDRYDTAQAVSAYSKLVSHDQVSAILMPTYGGVFATASRAVRDNVIVLNPLDCNDDIAALPENTFCVATQSESISEVIEDDLSNRGYSSVGILVDESNPFMVLVAKGIETLIGNRGAGAAYVEQFDQATRDFHPQLLRLHGRGVQALVFLGHDQMGQAMREARQTGSRAQFYTIGTITSPGFQKLAGDSAQGALVAFWQAPDNSAYRQFLERFKARVGRAPLLELATIPAYDSAKILAMAAAKSLRERGKVDIEAMKAYMHGLNGYQGLSGHISMAPDGAVRTIKESMFSFNNGKLQAVGGEKLPN